MFAFWPVIFDSGFQSVVYEFLGHAWDPYVEFLRSRLMVISKVFPFLLFELKV